MSYKYSFQLYSARHFPPMEPQLEALKAMGYDAVEPWLPAYQDSASDFRAMLDNVGLDCYGFHMPLDGLINEPNKYIDIAQTLGASLLIPPYVPPEERGTDADYWMQLGEHLATGSQNCEPHGLNVAWHNHDFEFVALADGSYPIDHIMGAGDNFGLEIDCGWIVRAGADPAEILAKYADRILAIQPKDTAPIGTKEDDGWTATGDGIIDWAALVPLFKATKADHIVTEHDNPSDWKLFAERSLTFLKGLPLDG